MGNPWDLEHQIPIRRVDLVGFLIKHPAVPGEETGLLFQVFQGLTALINFDFLQAAEGLKSHYLLFDPDSDIQPITPATGNHAIPLDDLENGVKSLLGKANFEKLNWDMVDTWLAQSREFLGMKVMVNSEEFDRLLMYYRGECKLERKVRRWWRPWRKDLISVPGLSRLALFIKMREKAREGEEVNTQKVFLKLFKDIPKTSVPMMFPGAKVKLNPFDKGLIGYPILAGMVMIFYNLVLGILKAGLVAIVGMTIWPLALAFGGYGYRTYYNYVARKQDYDLRMTKNLYYQTLDSNAGVLTRLVDEAEEQETLEALLAYFCLLKFSPEEGWCASQLDDYAELFVQEITGRKIDFEIQDALDKLIALGMVRENGGKLRAIPPLEAKVALAKLWNLRYQNLEAAAFEKPHDLPTALKNNR
ncbi:MAG: DUF3754 domain-containing protein [Gemmataceae bacterium]|nr:DUF3754 domain-containing protein [Gemmataceae bacterium]